MIQSIEVKQRISNSVNTMFALHSKKIVNSQNILRKIHFHMKVIRTWIICLWYQIGSFQMSNKIKKNSFPFEVLHKNPQVCPPPIWGH